mgnify:CR=1 FL=1
MLTDVGGTARRGGEGVAAATGTSTDAVGAGAAEGAIDAASILKPMLVGGVPLGLVCGTILYILTRAAVSAFQHRRRTHFESRQPVAENPEVEA